MRDTRRLAIFFNSVLINGAIYLACLPLLWFMALVFRARYDSDWRAFKVTAWLQLGFALTVPYLLFAEVPLGHAIGAPMIAAFLLGASAVLIVAFGLLTFPIVFFSLHRPRNWQRWNVGILTGYFLVVMIGYAVDQHYRTEQRQAARPRVPTDLNIFMYGQVLEADGRPAGGAWVTLEGCDYYRRNIIQADDDGIFRVHARCARALEISQIRNFSNALPCISDDATGRPGGPLARFNVSGPHVGARDEPYWGGHSRENPYRIACTWSR